MSAREAVRSAVDDFRKRMMEVGMEDNLLDAAMLGFHSGISVGACAVKDGNDPLEVMLAALLSMREDGGS